MKLYKLSEPRLPKTGERYIVGNGFTTAAGYNHDDSRTKYQILEPVEPEPQYVNVELIRDLSEAQRAIRDKHPNIKMLNTDVGSVYFGVFDEEAGIKPELSPADELAEAVKVHKEWINDKNNLKDGTTIREAMWSALKRYDESKKENE